jgi:hypothetical protein
VRDKNDACGVIVPMREGENAGIFGCQTSGGGSKMGQSQRRACTLHRSSQRGASWEDVWHETWPRAVMGLDDGGGAEDRLGLRRRKLRESQAGVRKGTPGNKSHALSNRICSCV